MGVSPWTGDLSGWLAPKGRQEMAAAIDTGGYQPLGADITAIPIAPSGLSRRFANRFHGLTPTAKSFRHFVAI